MDFSRGSNPRVLQRTRDLCTVAAEDALWACGHVSYDHACGYVMELLQRLRMCTKYRGHVKKRPREPPAASIPVPRVCHGTAVAVSGVTETVAAESSTPLRRGYLWLSSRNPEHARAVRLDALRQAGGRQRIPWLSSRKASIPLSSCGDCTWTEQRKDRKPCRRIFQVNTAE
jgi:hypothetical protein